MSLKEHILNFKKYQNGLFQAVISVNVNCSEDLFSLFLK